MPCWSINWFLCVLAANRGQIASHTIQCILKLVSPDRLLRLFPVSLWQSEFMLLQVAGCLSCTHTLVLQADCSFQRRRRMFCRQWRQRAWRKMIGELQWVQPLHWQIYNCSQLQSSLPRWADCRHRTEASCLLLKASVCCTELNTMPMHPRLACLHSAMFFGLLMRVLAVGKG